ncbi:DoxX family protein [Myroides albus]|uniref:DoxX family membrane protein n=1 Tax=Myroides albus TaxID=2562892 RepID=A0A6I3LRN8_9FLAO|nr:MULTISPECIES: DoxX family protein [Myroides]MTG98772.1 DoxX family membrane protein [Myroides albus]MVX36483.1 DoxX family membrane protein [Myroides sp. LoEW2-1]UVD81334.1 DoxX family protein [Myroides albus]
MDRNLGVGLLLARISVGLPMLFYGIGKVINGITFIQGMLVDKGLPGFLGYGVYAGEVVAPIMILLGFRTRIAGLVFAINCFTAMMLAQSTQLFTLNDNGGLTVELLLIYLLVSLSLFFTGSGKFALSTSSKWD